MYIYKEIKYCLNQQKGEDFAGEIYLISLWQRLLSVLMISLFIVVPTLCLCVCVGGGGGRGSLCNAVIGAFSSTAIILLRKKELV